MSQRRFATWLALNGALLIFVGLFVGAAIPLVPYPRLMLSAHNAGFTVSGTLSMIAALLLATSLCSISGRSAKVVIVGHVSLWFLSAAEVAAAFWGTKQATPLAAAEAGAQGAAQWQETLVTLCHIIPAILLIIAWGILVWGVWRTIMIEGEVSGDGSG